MAKNCCIIMVNLVKERNGKELLYDYEDIRIERNRQRTVAITVIVNERKK